MTSTIVRSKIRKALILFLWLLLWQLLAICIHNKFYFASPLETALELIHQGREAAFWQSILGSLARILGGYLIALSCALLLGLLSYRVPLFEELLSPLMQLLKSVPIAAVTVVLLIWWGAKNLVLCVSFMVVLPNVYASLLEGLKATDRQLLEMADVFHMSFLKRLLWIYRPALAPQLSAALSFSLGLSFKSGVAAEIIGLPQFSIGEQLYRDKIYLNTAGVFAWIIVVLIISAMCEQLLKLLFKLMLRFPAPLPEQINIRDNPAKASPDLLYESICKSYGDSLVLDTSLNISAGSIVHISAPSGSGKTTLLHILAGTLPADETLKAADAALVFQEDRLLPGCNALRNLFEAGCAWYGEDTLDGLIDKSLLYKSVEQLSGGERRRVAIARALLSPAPLLLLDEPFNGLDDSSRAAAAEWILKHRYSRTLIIVSHNEDDDALLGATRLLLNGGELEWK